MDFTTFEIERVHDTFTIVKTSEVIDGKLFTLRASKTGVEFTFRWDDPNQDNGRGHAYFWYDHASKVLRVEITKKGCGLVDCFFSNLYMGNNIDTSCLKNGCQPSEIIDLTKIGARDIWCYEGLGLKRESFRMFSENTERTAWLAFFDVTNAIFAALSPVFESVDSIDTLRESVNSNIVLKLNAFAAKFWLATMLESFEHSEMYMLGMEMAKESST